MGTFISSHPSPYTSCVPDIAFSYIVENRPNQRRLKLLEEKLVQYPLILLPVQRSKYVDFLVDRYKSIYNFIVYISRKLINYYKSKLRLMSKFVTFLKRWLNTFFSINVRIDVTIFCL